MAETPRKKTLEELRSEAIAKLERCGYDVRGKTPAQIRKMFRPQTTKRKLEPQKSLANQVSISPANSHKAAGDKASVGDKDDGLFVAGAAKANGHKRIV